MVIIMSTINLLTDTSLTKYQLLMSHIQASGFDLRIIYTDNNIDHEQDLKFQKVWAHILEVTNLNDKGIM